MKRILFIIITMLLTFNFVSCCSIADYINFESKTDGFIYKNYKTNSFVLADNICYVENISIYPTIESKNFIYIVTKTIELDKYFGNQSVYIDGRYFDWTIFDGVYKLYKLSLSDLFYQFLPIYYKNIIIR